MKLITSQPEGGGGGGSYLTSNICLQNDKRTFHDKL